MSTSSQPSFQVSPPVKPNSTLAIASLILGILGWTFLPLAGSLIAVITGHMAKSEMNYPAASGRGIVPLKQFKLLDM